MRAALFYARPGMGVQSDAVQIAPTYKDGSPISGIVSIPLSVDALKSLTLQNFGAVGDGVTDDTQAFVKAFAYIQNGGTVFGVPGARYKVTSKIAITGGYVRFDGRNCFIVNAISNATAADPIFEISGTGVAGVTLTNFKVIGSGNNGHVVANLGALSTGPQFITLERIWITSNSGNGKDNNGNPIPAQLFYSYGGMSIKIKECITYQSGGVVCNNTLKIHLNDVTFDSPPAGYLSSFTACNDILIDGGCVFNGGTGDQLEINGCKGVSVSGNRFKGALGRQQYIHGQNYDVCFGNNQHEVYSANYSPCEFTTATLGFKSSSNSFTYINSNGDGSTFVFNAPTISLIDEPGGGFISFNPIIEYNTLIVNNKMTIPSFVSVNSTLNSVRGLRLVGNNTAQAAAVTNTTVTTGFDLKGVMYSALVERNQYGQPPGGTMTTGISIGASCNGTYLLENNNNGNTTTPISNSGVNTQRREGGVIVPVTFTPTVDGTTTVGAGTYTSQVGTYTRDGNMVTFGINVGWSAHTGTGSMVINIPFTGANRVQPVSILVDSLGFTGQIQAAISAGATQIRLWSETNNGALSQLALDTAATLYITGTIEVQ